MMNNRNYVHWADENPRLVKVTKFQYKWSVNIWAALVDNVLES